MVAKSSVEVKFRVMPQDICEAIWIKWILIDQGVLCDNSIQLLCDNEFVIEIAKNLIQHDHTKHIKVGIHFIKEKLDSGLIITPYIPSHD